MGTLCDNKIISSYFFISIAKIPSKENLIWCTFDTFWGWQGLFPMYKFRECPVAPVLLICSMKQLYKQMYHIAFVPRDLSRLCQHFFVAALLSLLHNALFLGYLH